MEPMFRSHTWQNCESPVLKTAQFIYMYVHVIKIIIIISFFIISLSHYRPSSPELWHAPIGPTIQVWAWCEPSVFLGAFTIRAGQADPEVAISDARAGGSKFL